MTFRGGAAAPVFCPSGSPKLGLTHRARGAIDDPRKLKALPMDAIISHNPEYGTSHASPSMR
ncbi:hypothetical protein XH89_10215 [Bradyrhizobium sp. CCBAU 53340]|nr:hypothetical protein XH89_10215 [Bradyrhizobium sp. CCBAU 53340]